MSEAYKDKALPPKQRAADLLKRMSLDEKMAQVNCLFPYGDNEEQLRADAKFGIGEVSCLAVREIDSLEAAAAWQRRIQRMVMENSEHHIPAIFHMEGLCGAYLQGAASFPSGIGRASSWDPALEEKGASSADLRLKGSFCIEGSGFVEGKKRAFYAKAGISSGAPL